jgi:hypothetical protein
MESNLKKRGISVKSAANKIYEVLTKENQIDEVIIEDDKEMSIIINNLA